MLKQWAPPTAHPAETTPVEVSLVAAIPVAPIEPAALSVQMISAGALRQGGPLTSVEQRDIIDRLSQF